MFDANLKLGEGGVAVKENLMLKDEKKFFPPRTYIAIDLKSFYASVECIERGLDPMTTNLVVADASRTEKTICLAVSFIESLWNPWTSQIV